MIKFIQEIFLSGINSIIYLLCGCGGYIIFSIKSRLYEYFNYLLTEIPEHMDDKNYDFCEKLLPWSDELPAEYRKYYRNKAAQTSG